MNLIYIGDPKITCGVEGWPARNHDEPDEALYAAKIASRLYRSESGKEIKAREAERKRAKAAANAKAGELVKAEAVEARAAVKAAERSLEQAIQKAEELESRARAMTSRRGGK